MTVEAYLEHGRQLPIVLRQFGVKNNFFLNNIVFFNALDSNCKTVFQKMENIARI